MKLDTVIQSVLDRYGLATRLRSVAELEATHTALRIDANGQSYALRQFNPFMTAADLTVQARLAVALSEAGLPTPPPLPADDGKPFVEVGHRLWALFPWCDGHPGDSRQFDDLVALVEAQGKWVRCAGEIDGTPHWKRILSTASRFRQRKDWAWIVPLDQLPRYVDRVAMPALSSCILAGTHADRLRGLLPGMSDAASRLRQMLDAQSVSSMPHMISHGDLWASNICISEAGTHVLDLDCFSYEPRMTDFARAAHWYYAKHKLEENRHLMARFRSIADIGPEELRAVPALIFAHDLYYLVGAGLRFPTEPEAEQAEIVKTIWDGLERLNRWDGERELLEEAFSVGKVTESSNKADAGDGR